MTDILAARLVQEQGGLALEAQDGTRVRAATAALSAPRPGRDLLARAVMSAMKPSGADQPNGHQDAGASEHPPEVMDATAGLGADAFHLAALGLRVTMVERVPLVAALLADALQRARAGRLGEAARAAAANLTLEVGDALQVLAARQPGARPAVVLLDPMYPRRGKAALPGKGMALFRELVGADDDAADLLNAALRGADRRVVVKRPLKAPYLGGLKPSGSLQGSTTRYDLYAPLPGAESE